MNEWKNDVVIKKIDNSHCKLSGSHTVANNLERIFPIAAEEFIDGWVRWTNGENINTAFPGLSDSDKDFLLYGEQESYYNLLSTLDELFENSEHPRNEDKFLE